MDPLSKIATHAPYPRAATAQAMHVCQTGAEFDGTVKIEIRGSSSAREATKKSFSFVMAREESAAGSNGTSKKMSGFMGEWRAVKKQGGTGGRLSSSKKSSSCIAAKLASTCRSNASNYPGGLGQFHAARLHGWVRGQALQ